MRFVKLVCALLALCLAAGCSGTPLGSDVEALLRVPQLSGQTGAVQSALNRYLGVSATLRYPASGEFLSPFLFGDWDGDGTGEAAVLYTSDASTNVWLAILEPSGDDWRVTQTVEGLSGEVETVTYAHLRDADSLQLLVGYTSAQGDRYLVVYLYSDETLQTILNQQYTEMILADVTGSAETQDLVLAIPTDTENGGVTLNLLTNTDQGFQSLQTLNIGEGDYSGCAALHAGTDAAGRPWLVMDGWASAARNSLASSIITYDSETGFLGTYYPEGISPSTMRRQTLRYDPALLSTDIDGNGTIDIPQELTDGGILNEPLDSRLKFLLWQDYGDESGGNFCFGIYDSEDRFFLPLPESMHGNVLVRPNGPGTGWLLCNAAGTMAYCELRIVDPAEAGGENYVRIANIGSQQLQFREINNYYGLTASDLQKGVVLFE